MSAYIRPITAEDTPLVVKWRNSPSVVSKFIYRTPLTEEGHLNWFNTKIKTGQVVQFIIVEKETETPVGSVYLRDVDNVNRKAEFGIFIGEECARGKGYGTTAAKLILQHAFKKMNLNKVKLRVFADNASAIRCYEKVGFVKEGCFKEDVIIDGTPYDMVFMGILKSQWKEDE